MGTRRGAQLRVTGEGEVTPVLTQRVLIPRHRGTFIMGYRTVPGAAVLAAL
jgi:hypothetical protein